MKRIGKGQDKDRKRRIGKEYETIRKGQEKDRKNVGTTIENDKKRRGTG